MLAWTAPGIQSMDEAYAWMAKAAIAELITRYAALNDAGDWDGVAALYTEEGRMSRPTAPDEFIDGRAAILAAFRARPPRAARHIVANVLVTLDSGRDARASSQILLFTGVAQAGGPPVQSATPPLVGTYHDRLIRTEQGWRFVERRASLDFRAA
jgi:ketosteroid isomerase-like protein